jgi:TonB family protein
MCFPEGDLFFSVKVSPRQYLQYSGCPTIAYEIDKIGRVSRVQTLVSSGSRAIDSTAMDAVKARSFKMPQHCFSCRMETRVDVEF